MSAGRYWMRLSRFLTTVLMWVLRLSQIRMTGACSWWCAAAIRPSPHWRPPPVAEILQSEAA